MEQLPSSAPHAEIEGRPVCAVVSRSAVTDKHLHREVELIYLQNGELPLTLGGQGLTLRAGQLCCIGEGALHQYGVWSERTRIVKMKFLQDWLMASFLSPEEKEGCRTLYGQCFVVEAQPEVARIVGDMLQGGEARYREYYYLAKLMELTAWLLRHPQALCGQRPCEPPGSRRADAMLRYIQQNLCQPLTLSSLAEHMGLSACYCSKLIKRSIGLSFVQYLGILRVNHARRLVAYTDDSVTAIAGQCGFSSIQTFNRVFRQQVGMSPRAYRCSVRGGPSA